MMENIIIFNKEVTTPKVALYQNSGIRTVKKITETEKSKPQADLRAIACAIKESYGYVRENESLESALKRFKRKTSRDDILAETRKREHYEKPSVKRKKKAEAARKRKFIEN